MPPDWNTRLVVKLGDKTITPITSLTPTFTTPHTILHSIESDNVGIIRQPMTFTFTMAVPAVATAVADLIELALQGKSFDVAVAENDGNDWAFKALKFQGCYVTSASPSNIVVDGVPQASFTCSAMSVSVEV